jgi:hypothetical protein
LLLIKQQKWLSEFCVKIDRVASKNEGRIIANRKKGWGRRLKNRVGRMTVNTYFFFLLMKVKKANRLMSIIDEIWAIHLQKVDTLLMIGI